MDCCDCHDKLGVLTQSYVNPVTTLGQLVAEAATLTLNARFDECDADWSSSCQQMSDVKVCNQIECQVCH